MTIDWVSGLAYAGLYIGIPLILFIFWAQWKWARTCDQNIQILVAQKGGGGKYELAPKEGGDVTITNRTTGETRTWPINELATIDVPYPGLGFLPKWMQKSIRLAIVNEGDWEPMLNRSPHREKIASPDVIEFMQELSEKQPELKTEINRFLKNISSGSTREMIADPSTLGALRQNTIMRALATVSDDLVETIKGLRGQLSRVSGLSPQIVYIGLFAAVGLGIAIVVILLKMDLVSITEKINAIYNALGIVK